MKKNKQILILVGVPGSGKSTWAKNYIRNNGDWVRVSRDDLRLMLTQQQKVEPKMEDMINDLMDNMIESSISKGKNVIVDSTNLKRTLLDGYVTRFGTIADISYRVFDISLKKAIEQDKNREHSIGEFGVTEHYKKYKILIDSFPFQPTTKQKESHINPKVNECDAVIYDIDGTLSLLKNREYDDFHLVHRDDYNEVVGETIAFHRSKGRKIIILTGRSDEYRKETEDWLDLYGVEYDELHMRESEDRRRDKLVKREIYNNQIKPQHKVLCVYDDRISVIKEWNDLGLFVFTVNQGLRTY